jgi:hypothetical protein
MVRNTLNMFWTEVYGVFFKMTHLKNIWNDLVGNKCFQKKIYFTGEVKEKNKDNGSN